MPKDGPSAGITMATAMLSAITRTPVRADVAMTGEITLRGRVLPIGGLKEKLLAAKKAGIRTVLVPEKNRPDVQEMDQEITDGLIHLCSRMEEVLKGRSRPGPNGGRKNMIIKRISGDRLRRYEHPAGEPAGRRWLLPENPTWEIFADQCADEPEGLARTSAQPGKDPDDQFLPYKRGILSGGSAGLRYTPRLGGGEGELGKDDRTVSSHFAESESRFPAGGYPASLSRSWATTARGKSTLPSI